MVNMSNVKIDIIGKIVDGKKYGNGAVLTISEHRGLFQGNEGVLELVFDETASQLFAVLVPGHHLGKDKPLNESVIEFCKGANITIVINKRYEEE